MTYDEVLDRFAVEQRGDTHSKALCPHHGDQRASLSISRGNKGTLVTCQAGCDTGEVLADVGLTYADLFDEPKTGTNGHGTRQPRTIVATYPYVDEAGVLLYEKVRYDPKDFRVRRPDGRGGWAYSIGDTRRVLYRLPDLVTAIADGATIWIAEGEKDCDALGREGEVATCNFDGAGKWKREYTEALDGATLVQIVADDDLAGRNHALNVRDQLAAAGIPTTVWLPADGHKDIADHLGAGLGVDELRPLTPDDVDELAGLVKPFTDDANALRFTKTHADVLRFVPEWGIWLRWDGTRWERDRRRTVIELARGVARAVYHDALMATGDQHKVAMRWATTSANASRIHAMVDLARSAHGVPVLAHELDADPWLLNVANGTLDLHTGELRGHAQADLITKRAGCGYDPDATAPLFEAFLEQVLPDGAVRRFVQAFAGYCLTGVTSEQILLFAHGVGANGKTTLIQVLLHVMGEYAKQAEPDLLLARDNAHPTGVADLQGARLVVSSEIEDGRRLAEATVKQLTGSDRVKARYMRQDFFEFDPTHKLIIATNHKPAVRGTDHAIWRRIRLVPFAVTIDRHDQDPYLQERLRAEAEGILAWAVEGCRIWQDEGLPVPAAIAAATEAYRAEEDRVGAFISERCEIGPTYHESSQSLYAAYTKWAEANGEGVLQLKRLGRQLTERTFDRARMGARGEYHWVGIQLAHTGDDPPPPTEPPPPEELF